MVFTAVDNETTRKIIRELYKALTYCEVPVELLAIVGSWGDTLDDDLILELLEDYKGAK